METTESLTEKVVGHRSRAIQYLQNSKEAVAKKEYEKAGELLWGAIANYIHAFIWLKERKQYKKHSSVVNYGRSIAVQIGDERLLNAIEEADDMHDHFYDGSKRPSSFPQRLQEEEYAIQTLDRLLEEALKSKATPSPAG